MYAEQRRSSDNMSARSSDSELSDVSALSRASSASRLSSTSYMSIQSERPGGRLRSVLIGYCSYVLFKFWGRCGFQPMHPILITAVHPHPVRSPCLIWSYVICMLISVCLSVLFLHANCCMSLSVCMLCLLCPRTHTNLRVPNKLNSDPSR